jgi:hypothetical protein
MMSDEAGHSCVAPRRRKAGYQRRAKREPGNMNQQFNCPDGNRLVGKVVFSGMHRV